MPSVLVDINARDPRAPCSITGRLVNKKLEKRLLRELRKNGFPENEVTFLLQADVEALEDCLAPGALRHLKEYGWVRAQMDPFEAGNLYGYDGNEILSRLVAGQGVKAR